MDLLVNSFYRYFCSLKSNLFRGEIEQRMAMQEERFSLGENSNHMVTVTPFNATLKVHIRQFYVLENGKIKASRIGVTLSVEEFNELVKLIPKVQDSIARYELRDTGISSGPFELDLPVLDSDTVFLPSPQSQEPIPIIRDEELLDRQPKFPSPPPSTTDVPPLLIDPSLEKVLTDLSPKEKLERNHQDLAADDDLKKKRKEKRKRSKQSSKNVNKKLKTESKRTSGIFVGYCETPPELKVTEKKEKNKNKIVKKECIDEVDSVESMKEVERKLWLTHYDMLSKKLMEVIREKCTGCQMMNPINWDMNFV